MTVDEFVLRRLILSSFMQCRCHGAIGAAYRRFWWINSSLVRIREIVRVGGTQVQEPTTARLIPTPKRAKATWIEISGLMNSMLRELCSQNLDKKKEILVGK